MKVVGSVERDKVPQTEKAVFGVWTGLTKQAIDEYRRGHVLTVKVADQAEFLKMRNGMSERLRRAGFSRQFVTVEEPDGLLVYLQLVESTANGLPSVAPPPPRRRRAAAR
jgi:hypothetical protein